MYRRTYIYIIFTEKTCTENTNLIISVLSKLSYGFEIEVFGCQTFCFQMISTQTPVYLNPEAIKIILQFLIRTDWKVGLLRKQLKNDQCASHQSTFQRGLFVPKYRMIALGQNISLTLH